MTVDFRRAAFGCASPLAFAAACAVAASANAQSAPAAEAGQLKPEYEVSAVVVTAAKGRAAEAAPVASSLKAIEPQAVITRKSIEESAPRVGDYTTTAILAPSMATIPNSNGSGATDGAKITLRGFQDGEFNVTYDGIAWGDTNGPSHHSNSFFPSSVIGGVVIDRGPGRASDLGQANFGGSINLFSLPLENQPGFRQTATVGSYGTGQAVTTIATGPISRLHGANFVLNFMEYTTDGYLTNSPSSGQNQFIKGTLPINDKWSITGLFTRNEDDYNQGDGNSNATVAQVQLYGKRFALSNDPRLATYKGYNYTRKQTDFEYIRLNGDLGHRLTFDNTVYSYYYSNHTLSANNNAADFSLDPTYLNPVASGGNYSALYNTGVIGPNLLKANTVTTFPGNVPTQPYPIAPGTSYKNNGPGSGIPGYTKRNEYRVIGDILKGYWETPVGKLTVGAEYEHADTRRSRFDYALGPGLGTSVSDFREKSPNFPNSSSPPGCGNLPVIVNPGKTNNGACAVPLNISYSEYSGWQFWQPFAEFDWRVNDRLTVTPGVKYINFKLHVHAPELAVKGSIQPSYVEDTFTKTLPFLTANWRARPNLAFYAQYAQGFLVPSISAFYVNAPQNNNVVPQESTNYQLGTVFSAGRLTFDADVYYIDFKHKIQTITITDPTSSLNGETYQTNSGGATYKGVELQATYVLPYGWSTFGNFTVNQAEGKDDPLNPGGNGRQLAKAPRGTAALGFRYEHRGVFTADDAFVANLNTKWIGRQFATAASGASAPTGVIKSFNESNLTGTYRFGHYSLEAQILNLFDHRDITSFKGSGLIPGTNIPATSTAQAATLAQAGAIAGNIFTYQVARSYQLTFKMAF